MPRRKIARRKRRKPRKARRFRELVPSKMLVKMKYSDEFSLDAGLGSIAVHNWRANSIYDPDLTGVGHQAMGFDEYVGVFFDHYQVINAKATLYPLTTTAAALSLSYIGMQATDTTTAPTSLNDAIEQGRASWRLGDMSLYNATGPLRYSVNINKFLGRPANDRSDHLKGAAGSNPTEDVILQVFVGGTDASTDPTSVQFRILIEYDVELSEPKKLVGS